MSWTETWPGDPERGVPAQQVRVRLHAPPDPPPRWAAGEDTLWLSLPEDLTLGRHAKRVPVTLRWKVEAIRPRRGRLGRCAAELGLAYLRLRQAPDALPWYPDSPDKIYDHLWWALDSAERGWRRARLARRASGGTRGAEPRPRGRVRAAHDLAHRVVREPGRPLPRVAWPVDEPICDDDECWPEELPATRVRAAAEARSGLPVEIPGPLRAEEAGWCYLLMQQAVDALRRAAGVR